MARLTLAISGVLGLWLLHKHIKEADEDLGDRQLLLLPHIRSVKSVINHASVRSLTSGKKTHGGRTSEESSISSLKEKCIEDSSRQESPRHNSTTDQQQEPLAQTSPFESAHVKGKQTKAKQTEDAAHIFNKHEQAVTSPKQPLTLVKTNHELSQTHHARGPQTDSGTEDESNGQFTLEHSADLGLTAPVKPTDFQSLIDHDETFTTSGFKETVLEALMDSSQMKRLLSDKCDEAVHASSGYAGTIAQMSLESQESLHLPLHSPLHLAHQSEFQTLFDSTESDLSANTTDKGIVTPLIDYSYLTHVWYNNVLNNPSENNCQLYNTDVEDDSNHEHLHQGNKYNQATATEVITSSMLSANTSPSQNQTKLDDEALNSHVWAHVYCSEVLSGHHDGYCGCYEHVLDSVLENLPCSESPEDACDDFDCTAALHKTYVIFENEYEEDDWGIGLKFGEQLEDQPSSVHVQDVDGQICASLEIVDTNMNLISDNAYNVKGNQQNAFAENMDISVHKERRTDDTWATHQRKDTSITATAETKYVVTESLKLSGTAGDLLSEKKLEVRKSEISNQSLTFNIQQNHTFKTQANQSLNIQPTHTFTILPNSYKSPMSLCSLDALSETVSLQVGDYLWASSDDSHSFSSEFLTKLSMSIRTARRKRLRRKFFKSMYTAAGVEQDAGNETDLVSSQSMCLDSTMSTSFSSRDTVSESGSYQEAMTSYNRNLNPWTAYALVHEHTDYMSDSSSDIFNTTSCSITTSSQDADNDSSLEAQV